VPPVAARSKRGTVPRLTVLRRADFHPNIVGCEALKHQRRPLHAKFELHRHAGGSEPVIGLARELEAFPVANES